ncbi:ThiF family adenylyltransferase [Pseudolysinimonas sp.]|uniref:ThiF family adenylyltransferase n=1 Tax=Pseudolysinimonas sp. TaxID=2680009 RepID=UPI003F81AAA0
MPVDPQSPRFLRQRTLTGFGDTAQARLAAAHVVVIGAGGLGSAVLPALAAAGVGRITIVDDDLVEASNLHRQTIHGVADVGRSKAESAAASLALLAPEAEVRVFVGRFDAAGAADLLDGADLLVDGSDTSATRYLADDAAAEAGIPLVWGSALGWAGQVGVSSEAAGIGYRDLYPHEDPADDLSCEIVGVLPTVCAVIGGLMATEALKLLSGLGDPLVGRAQMYDARTGSIREVVYRRAGARPTAAVRHEAAAGDGGDDVDPAQLEAVLVRDGALLLDVREPEEAVDAPLAGSVLIPLGELERRAGELSPERPIVVACQRGIRSRRAVELLRAGGFRARQLAGGVDALRRSGR